MSNTRNAMFAKHYAQREVEKFFTTGNVWYVDSGASNASDSNTTSGWGKDQDHPLATIDGAYNKATASNGDIIFVMPGHAEDKTTTGALITCDKAGIRIVGLGHGNIRPTLTFNHTGADIDVTADDNSFENIIFKCSVGDQTHVFDVTAKRFRLLNCKQIDDAATDNYVDFIDCSSTTNNNADGLEVVGCEFYSDDTGNDSIIEANADIDSLIFDGNFVRMGVADNEPVIEFATGKDATNARITGNLFYRANTAGALVVETDTTDANNGIFAYNGMRHADTATEVWITAGTVFGFIQNYATAVNDSSGFILPAVDS